MREILGTLSIINILAMAGLFGFLIWSRRLSARARRADGK